MRKPGSMSGERQRERRREREGGLEGKREREREKNSPVSLFIRALMPSRGPPPLMT